MVTVRLLHGRTRGRRILNAHGRSITACSLGATNRVIGVYEPGTLRADHGSGYPTLEAEFVNFDHGSWDLKAENGTVVRAPRI